MADDVGRTAKTHGKERPATGDEFVRPAVTNGMGTEMSTTFPQFLSRFTLCRLVTAVFAPGSDGFAPGFAP
jgi:hypothetical protein